MMELWYKIAGTVLPFEWMSPVFMKNALLAVLLVTPLFGMLGTMVVNKRMAFFSDALGHSALTGIAIGVLFGIGSPLWAMLLFAILLSVLFILLKNFSRVSTDTIIGVIASAAVALGIVLLSRGGGFNKYTTYLIGDLLSITPGEIGMLAVLAVVAVVLWAFIFNRLLLISVDQALASSRGVHSRLVDGIFTVLIAVTVTVSIQWVGLLIINSLLVLPAASARNVSTNVRQYHFLSMVIALFSGVTGLALSFFLGTATGATIVLVNFVIFALSFLVKLVKRT
jgi:zinc transport system permease protein